MNPRERIITALNHRKPDRMPQYEIFLQGYLDKWRQAGGLNEDANIYDHYPQIDIGAVLAMQGGPFPKQVHTEQADSDIYYERDSWGRLKRHRRDAMFFEVLDTAIKEKNDLDKLEFENPLDSGWYDGVEQTEKDIHNRFAPVSGVMGLFMPCWYLRGEIPFLMDLVEDVDFCQALIDKVMNFLTVVGEKVLEHTHTWDTALWVYDDFGTNESSLIAPAIFEKIFLPPYKKMISCWKAKGAQNIILHFDGNSTPFIDMFLEAGFTGIQGIYPTTGMTIPAMKAKYGKQLNLIGGVCNIHILTRGTKKEIEYQVASIVEVAKDGGVVIGSHSIDVDIPIENYDYYYQVLEKLNQMW